MRAFMRNTVQTFVFAILLCASLSVAMGAESYQDGILEEMFFVEDILPDGYEEPSNSGFSRVRRQVDVSAEEFVSFEMTLVGDFSTEQRTSGNDANAELVAELETLLGNNLDANIQGVNFVVSIDSTTDLSRRRKRQTSPDTTSLKITGEISFFTTDLAQMVLDLSRALQNLNWGSGLVIFAGTASEKTLDVQFPRLARQTNALDAAVCYLCQNYESCTQMTNGSYFCTFQDDRFYPFGLDQSDGTLDKENGQTSARLSIQEELPYGSTLYSTVWLSLYGTISFGRRQFNSFAVQDLPVPGFNVVAVYWSHWVHSNLGEVYFQRYIKSDSNTPEQLNVLRRANEDVLEYMFKRFDATFVLVVTWDRVLSYHGTSDTERASFQAAVISDGTETFLTFIYGHRALQVQQVSGNRISVGWGSSTNARLGSQANYFNFDTVSGDTGKNGLWFFKIGAAPNSRVKCINWFNQNVNQLFFINFANNVFAPRGCPCSWLLAMRRPWWIQVVGQPNCFDLAPRRGLLFGRRCCYVGNSLDNRIPTAGSYQAVNPFSGFYQLHLLRDVLPKQWCCVESRLCALYYTLRPRSGCFPSVFRRTFQWGDPHAVSVDGKSFTFNNVGEFVLLNVNGKKSDNVTVDVKLQARTCRATNVNGTLTDASVWCAFAMETTQKSKLQVSTQKGQSGQSYLLIFANDREYTVAFRDSAVFEEQNEDLFMSKDENGTLQITVQEGVSFSVTVSDDVMEFSVDINDELQGMTSGIMGTFNNEPNDDFTYPNRTVLDPEASEREIYDYVKTWAVTASNTIFTYENNLGTANFSDPSFVPLFLDEQPTDKIDQAAAVCGGTEDRACVFDFIATSNEALALRTKAVKQQFDTDEIEDALSAPNVTSVSGDDTVNVIFGTPAIVTFEVSQADNLAVNVTFQEENMAQYTFEKNDGGTVEVKYMPQANTTLIDPPTLVAVNERNLTTLTTVRIVQCSGCNGNGQCDFNNIQEDISPYAAVASCICDRAYSGLDCSEDKDGCEGFPCPEGTNCTDVSADEEKSTNVSFKCSDCPPGYIADVDRCADVNECENSTACPNHSDCKNTIGSFTCVCSSGFRKDSAGQCVDVDECIELLHNCQQLCINNEGTYSCACRAGFSLDALGFNCTRDMIDVCADTQANCSYGCEIVNGAAQCFCDVGFQVGPDGRSCIDVDECDFDLCAQRCINSEGSYSCQCLPGYKLDLEDNHECVVCEENMYGENCASMCECKGRATACDNVRGCQCVAGWSGTSCETDVNECLQLTDLCPPQQQCVNTNGSYTCECPTGYAVNGDVCDDIDECSDQLVSQCPQDCTNSPGSFFCSCRIGYVYNIQNNTCDDIDECLTGLSGCEHDCVNVRGSYNCQCKIGFVLNDDRKTCRLDKENPCGSSPPNCSFACALENDTPTCFCETGYKLQTDQVTCADIDECEDKTDQCTDNCTNTEGSYNCSCPIGKKLENDGRTCVACDPFHWGENCATQCDCNPLGTETCDPKTGCKCKVGWNGTTCKDDILECSDPAANPCPDNAVCTDTPGSFICMCATGYRLENGTCVDVDECQIARCDQTCSNTIGSFKCSCDAGFYLEDDTECLDIDECANQTLNDCEQTCRNLAGGYQCGCRAGYSLDLINRRSCIDIDECADTLDHTCSNYQLCSNTPGTFTCGCKPGYEETGDNCTASTGGNTTVLPFSIRLDIPGASDRIFNSSTQDFRVMEAKVATQVLQEGKKAIGGSILSVVVVKFTPGSIVADSRIAFDQPEGSEALASSASILSTELRSADLSAVAPGASVLNISVEQYQLNDTTNLCDVFTSLYQCGLGSTCNDTDGTPKCSEVPPTTEPPTTEPPTTEPPTTEPPTTEPPTTEPPATEPPTTAAQDDDDNTALIIGLSVAGAVFLLLVLLVVILVYCCSKKRRSRPEDDQSSQASGQGSFPAELPQRWKPNQRLPYAPVSFHDSGSSRSASTASGQARARPVFPKFSGGQFESPWMAKEMGVSSYGSPREESGDPRADRPERPNTNSNFSWEYMFSLLEPHVPLEIQRPQLRPSQTPDTRDGSGGNSSSAGNA